MSTTNLDDVRDINVETCHGDDRQNYQDLRAIADKIVLRNYRGPIESIKVTSRMGGIAVEVVIFVIDVNTKRPVRLTAGKSYPEAMYAPHYAYEYLVERASSMNEGSRALAGRRAGRAGYITAIIRETIRYAVLHELDESLLYDGQFVTDPHPEQKLYPLTATAMLSEEALSKTAERLSNYSQLYRPLDPRETFSRDTLFGRFP